MVARICVDYLQIQPGRTPLSTLKLGLRPPTDWLGVYLNSIIYNPVAQDTATIQSMDQSSGSRERQYIYASLKVVDQAYIYKAP